MKYYSEKLNKLYDNKEELIAAEEKVAAAEAEKAAKEKELKEKRAARAKEVQEAFEKVKEANAEATKKLNDFIKDYGSYHCSFSKTCDEDEFWSILDWFNTFVKI